MTFQFYLGYVVDFGILYGKVVILNVIIVGFMVGGIFGGRVQVLEDISRVDQCLLWFLEGFWLFGIFG